MPRRSIASALLLLLSAAVPAAAQDTPAAIAPRSLCYPAKPKPACSAFLLTNFGAYYVVAGGENSSSSSTFRAVADWGFMVNVSTRDAIGASVFASVDANTTQGQDVSAMIGPTARYRRWMSPRTSLEFAVGTPLLLDPLGDILPGSVLGLVSWSPAPWFAVTARPELLRIPVYSGVGGIRSRGRVSIGMEVGEFPGLTLTVVAATAIFIAIVSSFD